MRGSFDGSDGLDTEFRIDGERGFMVLYVRSPELNSVATEVRTGAMKAVG